MTSSQNLNHFNNLFDQIIHSEFIAQERKNRLVEVKTKIQTSQDKLVSIKQDWESQRGRQVLKIKQLNEEELKLKWLSNKEMILLDQKSSIQNEKKEINRHMEDIVQIFDNNLMKFMKNVTEFMTEYDLTGRGRENREFQLKEEIEQLIVKEKELLVDVDQYDSHFNEIERLGEEREKIQNVLNCLFSQNDEKSRELCELKALVTSLEQEKLVVSQIPQSHPEFCRLRSEVNHHRAKELDQKHETLQRDISELQHILRQKQIQKQQKTLKMERKHPSFYSRFDPDPNEYAQCLSSGSEASTNKYAQCLTSGGEASTNKYAQCLSSGSEASCIPPPAPQSPQTHKQNPVSYSQRKSRLSQEPFVAMDTNSQELECETSNRLCITSYPLSVTDSNSSRSEKILCGDVQDDIKTTEGRDQGQLRSSRSSKYIFTSKRKKST